MFQLKSTKLKIEEASVNFKINNLSKKKTITQLPRKSQNGLCLKKKRNMQYTPILRGNVYKEGLNLQRS